MCGVDRVRHIDTSMKRFLSVYTKQRFKTFSIVRPGNMMTLGQSLLMHSSSLDFGE